MAMTMTAMEFLRLFSGTGWLMGPLFDKELRVASRRTRSYALRSGYLVLLSILMLSAWLSFVGTPSRGFGAFTASRASGMSLYVANRVIWFQFAAAQIVAAVVVSFSVTDEIRRGTMSVLMTTPITSVQIVAGKLLGGLLQVMLLLAVGLPVLAVLRVLGGLSWDCVRAAFCITFSAAAFAGALSLLLSTRYHHPYQVLSAGAVVYFVAFLVPPVAALLLTLTGRAAALAIQPVVNLTSPFYALWKAAPRMSSTGLAAAIAFPWPVHCLILLATAALMLGVATPRIRRRVGGTLTGPVEVLRAVHRPRRSPVTWRDNPGLAWYAKRGDRIVVSVALAAAGVIVLAGWLSDLSTAAYLFCVERAFWMVAILRLAISASAGITLEKERGTWPLLLATPLNDIQIVQAKAWAALRRSAVLLLSAFAIQLGWLLSGTSTSHVVAALLSTLSRAVSVLFVLAAALYFGVRLKTTTVAAAAAAGTSLCLIFLVSELFGPLLFRLLWTFQARSRDPAVLTLAMAAGMVLLYVPLAGWFFERAQRNVRRYVF
jgi:ABC-type transport system involved in multi-copper enzyme maturation permease subunit